MVTAAHPCRTQLTAQVESSAKPIYHAIPAPPSWYSGVICPAARLHAVVVGWHLVPSAFIFADVAAAVPGLYRSIWLAFLEPSMASLSAITPSRDYRGVDLSCCRHASNITSLVSLIDQLNPQRRTHFYIKDNMTLSWARVLFNMEETSEVSQQK